MAVGAVGGPAAADIGYRLYHQAVEEDPPRSRGILDRAEAERLPALGVGESLGQRDSRPGTRVWLRLEGPERGLCRGPVGSRIHEGALASGATALADRSSACARR